jgi:hypothetical protein
MENNEELPVIEFESPKEPDIEYVHVIGTPEEEAEQKRIIDSAITTTTEVLPVIQLGRPSLYTQELADQICEQLAEGISLRTVCLAEDMPSARTVFRWLRTNEDFCQQYARAKEESADALFEETIDIADESLEGAQDADPKSSGAIVQAYRLRVDTRKWYMSKMKPKKYGDKIDHTTDGKAFPTPIMQLNVQSNNSNEQNSITE